MHNDPQITIAKIQAAAGLVISAQGETWGGEHGEVVIAACDFLKIVFAESATVDSRASEPDETFVERRQREI